MLRRWTVRFMQIYTAFAAEGCIYLIRGTAIQKADFVVDGVILHRWSSITAGLSSGAMGQFIQTPSPRNILLSLTKTCASNNGILGTMGYTNILNVEALVKSKPVQDGLESGRK